MTPDEYAARQAAISAAVAAFVQKFARFFKSKALTTQEWLDLLGFIFPEVVQRRLEAAALGRQFFDSQRLHEFPELPINPRPLEGTTFETFVKNMDGSRKLITQADSPEHAVTLMTMRTVREVENAGRQQIIHAVDNDPVLDEVVQIARTSPDRFDWNDPNSAVPPAPFETKDSIESGAIPSDPTKKIRTRSKPSNLVKGWARVATGKETCAWCLMLISRGPVYSSAAAAGLDVDNSGAVKLIAAGEDVTPWMQQWHTGCDCKVVPVYNKMAWTGKEAASKASNLWADASREVTKLVKDGKADETNRNRETINALRRRIDRGEITAKQWAAISAA